MARVRGCGKDEARRIHRGLLAAHDDHPAILQRLAQRLERMAPELRELVEEQDALVRQARLARARDRAATDEPGRRDRVVRRPKGARRAFARPPSIIHKAW